MLSCEAMFYVSLMYLRQSGLVGCELGEVCICEFSTWTCRVDTLNVQIVMNSWEFKLCNSYVYANIYVICRLKVRIG